MTEEEIEAIEQDFQYALDEILSLVKYETATAIVHKEQSMILLFKKLLLKIDNLQNKNKNLEEKINKCILMIDDNYRSEWYDDYETIAGLRDDIYDLLKINIRE